MKMNLWIAVLFSTVPSAAPNAFAAIAACDTTTDIAVNFGKNSVLGSGTALVLTRDGFRIHGAASTSAANPRGYAYDFRAGERVCYTFTISQGITGGGGKDCVNETKEIKDDTGRAVAEIRAIAKGLVELRWNTSVRKGEFRRSDASVRIEMVKMTDGKASLTATSFDQKGRIAGSITRSDSQASPLPTKRRVVPVDLKPKKRFKLVEAGCPAQIFEIPANSEGQDMPPFIPPSNAANGR